MPFREINSKMIEATVVPGQRLFSQRGAMLAYKGEVSFTPNIAGRPGRRHVDDRPPGGERGRPR